MEDDQSAPKELLKEFHKAREERDKALQEMSEIPEEVRDYLRDELALIAHTLHENYGLSIPVIKRLLIEIVSQFK